MLAHLAIFFHVPTEHLKNRRKTNIVELHFLPPINMVYRLELEAAGIFSPIVSNFHNLFGITWYSS